MPTSENKRLAEHIEERRAQTRRAEHVPESEYYDLDASGQLVEVKTTKRNVASDAGGRKGRYQIDESNHDQLVEAGGVYDFVLRDDDGDVVDVETRTAEAIDELVDERNREWPTNSKLKIRYDVLHDL